MAFSPFARFRNFTLDNLKALLEVYPDESRTMRWREAADEIEKISSGYKRTSYQQACQFGIEDRGDEHFRIQNYLFTFDDANLKRYLEFWIKAYYAPNPYVKGDDEPFIIYCEIIKEIIASPYHEIRYYDFFEKRIGGKSDDILLNAIKGYAEPVKVKKVDGHEILFIEDNDIVEAESELGYIETHMPIGNANSRKEFFDRFSYENFCGFFGIENEFEIIEEKKEGLIGKITFCTGYHSQFSHNRIVFGAPGTGKSFMLNSQKKELIEDGGDYERVTFHPNYSYANFVGAYKPISVKNQDGKDDIQYEYVPGPFMRILVKALENGRNKIENVKPYLLLIEEINRANVAAVFGEVFQLLDRNSKNVSEYSIHVSEDIKKYLMDKIHVSEDEIKELRIPDNMYIWATMNSADQGVFPMDTAFKRRWEFEYIGINDEASKIEQYVIPIGMENNRKYVKWNELRTRINNTLSSDECKVNEDKLLGPFFISKNMLENALTDEDKFVKAFESKVIMYLFEDVMKMRPSNIFKGHKGRMIFSEICKTFEEKGAEVFGIMDIADVERPT